LWTLCRYADGTVAGLETGRCVSVFHPLELRGTGGLLSLDWAWNADQEDIRVYTGTEETTHATETADAFEEQLLHVCECLATDTTPRFTVDESVRNLAVIDAMLESAASSTFTTPDAPHGF
jgi:hypothetical protein